MTFDISDGCKHNCNGCMVIKEKARLPTDLEWVKLFNLVEDLRDNNVDIAEITLGPTDLLSAHNREEIFNSPLVKEFVDNFKVINFNITCLSHKDELYEWFGKQVSNLGKDKYVYLFIPVEASQLYNRFYLDNLRYRIGIIHNCLSNDVSIEQVVPVMNIHKGVVFNKKTGEGLTQKIYHDYYNMKLYGDSYFDFGIHYGRDGLSVDDANDFIDIIKLTNDIRLPIMDYLRDRATNRHADFLTELNDTEGIMFNLYWNEGKMYKKVHVGEVVPICDERFNLNLVNWDTKELVDRLTTSYLDQYEYGNSLSKCKSCPFIINCALADRFRIMQIANTDRCFFLKRDLLDNNMEIY